MNPLLGNADNTAEWYNVIAQFQAKAAEFQQAYESLLLMGPELQTTPLYAEFKRLVDYALSTKETILKVTAGIETANKWLDQGLNAADMQGATLGLPFWLIPLTAIAGAVTAITKWLVDYNQFKLRWNEYQSVKADLLDTTTLTETQAAERAAQVVDSIIPPTSTFVGEALKNLFPFAILGVGVWLASK